jgi:hypothetical protein
MPKTTTGKPLLVSWDLGWRELCNHILVSELIRAQTDGRLTPYFTDWGPAAVMDWSANEKIWPILTSLVDKRKLLAMQAPTVTLHGGIKSPQTNRLRPELGAAIKKRLNAGRRPGDSEPWKTFFEEVRKSCGKKVTDRGFGDRSIKRIVGELKQDK